MIELMRKEKKDHLILCKLKKRPYNLKAINEDNTWEKIYKGVAGWDEEDDQEEQGCPVVLFFCTHIRWKDMITYSTRSSLETIFP